VPLEYLQCPPSLTEATALYRQNAICLSEQAVQTCLDAAGVAPQEIDMLITVSCTGVIIPSLDAYLVERMGFRRNVRRLPITELGCAGGAAAMSLAHEFSRGMPNAKILIVTLELPTLTFQLHDLSMANMVSMALFGDGAAAALMQDNATPGAQILEAESYQFPDTLDAMGFDLKDSGLHIVLSKDVPEVIHQHIQTPVKNFLTRCGLALEQLSSFVLHPGGRKLLEGMEADFNISRASLLPSWNVLRNYGNLSSASILFVLKEWLERRPAAIGELGLMAAFGPGFSAELLLFRWV
jgi:alkylresorcinol/alkylpyrone synthase